MFQNVHGTFASYNSCRFEDYQDQMDYLVGQKTGRNDHGLGSGCEIFKF